MKEEMEQALARVDGQIRGLQEKIAVLPAGRLVCARNGNRVKWYCNEPYKQTYIPKGQKSLAEQLAVKACMAQELADLENKRAAILAYLEVRKPVEADERIVQNPRYARLLEGHFTDMSQELQAWVFAQYEKNPVHPEGKVHKCCSGEMVRSKAEAMIAQSLFLHKIPFRYECALHVDFNVVYPDFTIRHPKTGELYYWEHFGMMDDARYAANTVSKLDFYIKQGIVPSIHLIATYEMKGRPLTPAKIESIVQEYFGGGV